MSVHLERDLAGLKRKVLAMGGRVEQMLEKAASALIGPSIEDAKHVLDADAGIDRRELEIDEDCLKMLALHQPVAGDLRFVTATMKITNDLERIGDLASNIAQRALLVARFPPLREPLDLEEMTRCTRGMLRDSLGALVERNAELARDVCGRDDIVDDLNRGHFEILQRRMKDDPDSVDPAVALLSASRSIERIADLATNIAEDVVFLVEARDIRHPSLGPD